MTANCPRTSPFLFIDLLIYFPMRNARTADSVELKVCVIKASLPYPTGRGTEECRHEDDQFSGTVWTARLLLTSAAQYIFTASPIIVTSSPGSLLTATSSLLPLPLLRRPSYPCGRIPWGTSITTSLCSYNLYATKYTFQFALAFS